MRFSPPNDNKPPQAKTGESKPTPTPPPVPTPAAPKLPPPPPPTPEQSQKITALLQAPPPPSPPVPATLSKPEPPAPAPAVPSPQAPKSEPLPNVAPPPKPPTQNLPTPASLLQGIRSSFSKTAPIEDPEKKPAPKVSAPNAPHFESLTSAATSTAPPLSPLTQTPAARPPQPAEKPPAEIDHGSDEKTGPTDRIQEATITAARNLLKQCREAGLIAMEEAIKLVPKPSELQGALQLQVICRKIGAQSPVTLQKSICDSLGLPIFPIKMFSVWKKGIPPPVTKLLKAYKMIPIQLEYSEYQDGRRHGYITVGAEHPYLDELVLEICHSNGLPVLFAFVIVMKVNELNSISENEL